MTAGRAQRANAPLFGDADSITVLHSHGPLLAKRITRDGITDYDDAKLFDVYPTPVTGLDDIHDLLRRLIVRPRCCVIRGELIDASNRRGVRRLLHDDDADKATFRDVPRQALSLDAENIELPPGVSVTDLAACARLAIRRLPAAFQHARCIVQASAGHGIKPDIRLRLWWWLSRATFGHELERWLADLVIQAGGFIDPVSFRAVQPIYTAAPIFIGTPDPLPSRLMILPGEEVVQVPSAQALAPPPRPQPPDRAPHSDRYVDAALASAVRTISRASNGTRHNVLLTEGACLLRFVPDRLSAGDFAVVLEGAARAAGLDQQEIDDAIGWFLARGGVA
jgi:hypothetical protein